MATVTKNDEGTWDYQCPHQHGCGVPGGESFASRQWPTKKAAELRGAEHEREHETGEPMSALHIFREQNGVQL